MKMLAELHCHSHYSRRIKVKVEGLNSPAEMIRHAKQLGMGAIAITDHDVFKAHKEASAAAKKYGIIYIPSEEVDTEKGHILALGISEWIKPQQGVRETIDEIHSQGGTAIASHPFDINDDGIKQDARFCDAMEIFNSLNLDRIANIKSRKFAQAHNIPAVAGSDAHSLDMMGYGLNEVDAWDLDSVLKEIRKGKAEIARRQYIPIGVLKHWSVLRLKSSYEQVMDYIEKNYKGPKKAVSKRMLKLVRGYPGSVNHLFRIISYVSIASAIAYSAVNSALSLRGDGYG